MTRKLRPAYWASLFLVAALTCGRAQTTTPVFPGKVQEKPIPDEYSDPETHLRVLHLSRFPTNYGSVVYFTYNSFSADSRYAFINSQFKDKWRYLYTYDFKKNAVTPLVTDKLTQNQVVVAKSGNLYYQADNAAWVVPLTGGKPRKLCDLPARWSPGIGFTVNANETLLLGGSTDTEKSKDADIPSEGARNGPNILFTINLRTGQLKVIHRENHWLGHVQFSPTDPDLCMFCHEGDWGSVDRMWFINPSKSVTTADGSVTSNARIAYHRTEPDEIAGHEFWSPDGKSIWFQQSFRKQPGHETFLMSMEVSDGHSTQYQIPEGFQSIHETFSPDGTFLISDGTGKGQTEPDKYISKLTLPTDGSHVLKGKHLVTLQDNDYQVEPNPHVSPDNHWVIYTATVSGTPQAYAVELPQN